MGGIDGATLAQHNSRESCWVVIHGKVWDVTEFLEEHPGGAGVILKCAGKDATKSYDVVHSPELIVDTLPPNNCLGPVDATTLPQMEPQATPDQPKDEPEYPPLVSIVAVTDFEKVAHKYLSPSGWAYYDSGADDELSIADCRRLFNRITLRPRILRHVEPVSTATTILGHNSSLPVYISPTGLGKYAHPDAENIIAATAGQDGIIYCMPTSASHEAVFNSRSKPDQPLFFQLYANRDRALAEALIRKVERLGAGAIFLTVDSPVLGKRERDDRLRAAEGDDTISANAGGLAKVSSRGMLNPLLSWDDVAWIRSITKLPLVLKGIQTVEDAVLAYTHGVQGIVLSHHGGRSQDTSQAPILTLLEIRRHAPHLLMPEIRSMFQVFMDGGIRRGTDVIKAVALGASAVGIGRPVLYSLCGGYGEQGLHRLINILRSEIEMNMALAGARCLEDLVPEMVNSERAENEVSRRIKL